jgi:NAD(P) transhydrogenase subunit beta
LGTYGIISLLFCVVILIGIKLMSSPKTAALGNRLGALSMFSAILLVLIYNKIIDLPLLWIAILIGAVIGYYMAIKVSMIQMPQMVALLNGLGGWASAFVALVVVLESYTQLGLFSKFTSQLALVVGSVTLSGSIIAAAKLDRRISQQPVIIKGHNLFNFLCLTALTCLVIAGSLCSAQAAGIISLIVIIISLVFGLLFSIRVGGADMPITISLLNSCSGLAGAICGLTIADPLLVGVGAIVGAAGIILTGIMCKAMNRSLLAVLSGSTSVQINGKQESIEATSGSGERKDVPVLDVKTVMKEAENVIIVPGYGMALAQAQGQVKRLLDLLEKQGKDVKFAIHPVAGRMPGHMNVLLAEVDVPYDQLWEMDQINTEFKETDAAVVIGACDVVNPAAISMEGTPIYGMPILRVDQAKNIVVCNKDLEPGYSGVPNPLYEQSNVLLMLGNAANTLDQIIDDLKE